MAHDQSGPTTVILPVNLGAASKYEEDIFPLAYHDAGNVVQKGSLLLSATLDEMIKIAEMGIDLKNDQRFHFNARIQYEVLAAKEEKLKSRPKSLNPFTVFRHYRAARMFHAASKSLFLETKRTSERLQREERLMRAVPSAEMHAINNAVPQEATLDGIAVTLPGALDAHAQQTILAAANAIASRASASDPFIDNLHIPQMSDNDSVITLADTASLLSQDVTRADTNNSPETEPSNPAPSYHFYFYNSMLTAGSNVRRVTLNHVSSDKGSNVIPQESPP